jgi:hypothetical protein
VLGPVGGSVDEAMGRGRGPGLVGVAHDAAGWKAAMRNQEQAEEAEAAAAVEATSFSLLMTRQRKRRAPRNRARMGMARVTVTSRTGTNGMEWTIREEGRAGRSPAATAARNGECLACYRAGRGPVRLTGGRGPVCVLWWWWWWWWWGGGGEVGGVRQAEISSGEDRSRYNGRRNQPPCHGAPAAGHA